MRAARGGLAALVLAAHLAPAIAADATPFSLDDYYLLATVSEPAFSPSGERLVYTVSRNHRKDDKVAVPPLVGALLKNEQDVTLFEKLVFMQRHNR